MNRYFCYAALLTGCLLAAAGCAWMNPADSSEDSHLETIFKESAQALPGAWKLRLLGERSSTQEPELAKLTLNFTGEQVNGFAGVNRFFGAYRLSGDAIQLGPLGMTMMAGPESAMQLERDFTAALNSADRWEIEAGKLTLFQGQRRLAVFDRAQ